jgi:hypothetical protein
MNVRHALSIVGALGLLASTSLAATTAPYSQSFEGSWAPDAHWAAGGGGTVATSASAVLANAGSQGLIVSNDIATLSVAPSSYTNVWIQIYARPVKGSGNPTVTGASGAFYINSSGRLIANDGGSWTDIAGGFSDDQYYGFVVHANYTSDTYDIYSTPNEFKSTLTLVNTNVVLNFIAGDPATLDNVKVQSGDRAYVDAVAVSRAFQGTGEADSIEVYEHSASSTVLQEFQMPAYSGAYTDPASNKTLGGKLGNDIKSGLVDNDKIYVWSANSWGYNQYFLDSGVIARHGLTPGAELPSAMTVNTMTSLQIDQTDIRGTTYGFYPYSNLVAVAVEGEVQQDTGVQEDFELNGTTAQPQGWTALNWSDNTPIDELPFNNVANFTDGDFMFLSTPANPNSWTVYEWQEQGLSGYWFRRVGAIPIDPIPSGANMWVKRQDPDPAPVTIIH